MAITRDYMCLFFLLILVSQSAPSPTHKYGPKDSFWRKLLNVIPVEKSLDTLQARSTSQWLTCTACKVAAKSLQWYIHWGASKERVAGIATYFCKRFGVSTDRACEGISREFQDEVMYVFSQVSLNPAEICGTIVDEDCGSSATSNMWNVTFSNITKPPVRPVHPPQPDSPKLNVLHLSDIHLDPDYVEGALAGCKEPLCCHETSANGRPVNAKMQAGKWGDYKKCDTPIKTLENTLKQISQTQKVDYIMWTGDDTPHNIWNQTRENQISILTAVGTLIQKYFPGVYVFPALGNHEGIPVNSFPVFNGSSYAPMSWLYEALNASWSRWLPANTQKTINKGGYYSVEVSPGFRIISLNMNFCNNLNWWLLLNTTDPADELQWLINELQSAEDKIEKVHIIGHIPPGSSDCLEAWSYNYYKIISRYESTIRGQFFGHTHVDEFELFYDVTSGNRRPLSVAYVGPSITPYTSLNPSYRIYTMDGFYSNSTWAVLDHQTYYFNLTEANLYGKPKWRLQYSAKNAYNISSLQPEDWDKLVTRLSQNNQLFQSFYKNYHHSSDAYPRCDAVCKTNVICGLQTGRSFDQTLCKVV